MGFGSAFKKAWNAASDFGRKTASEIVADVNAAKAYAVQGARAVANAAHDAGVAVKNTAVAAKNTAVKAGLAVKNAAVAAGNAAKDAAIATKDAVVSTAKKVGNAVTSAGKQVQAVTAAAVNDAYKQVHAVFGRQPVGQPIQPCPEELGEKKARLSERQYLITAALTRKDWRNPAEREAMVTAAKRLAKNNKVVERARLANDVYHSPENREPSPPVGWEPIRKNPKLMQELGFGEKEKELNDLLEPPNLGFRADVYYSEFEGNRTLVVAFKGTESREDWEHNARQAVGAESAYYRHATNLAKTLKRSLPNDVSLELTGHSLGGGMASAASINAGIKSVTFNAAGLHPRTVDYQLDSAPEWIDAYQVEGEILSTVQDRNLHRAMLAAGSATGNPTAARLLLTTEALDQPLVYDAAGNVYPLPAVDEKDKDGQGYRRPINDFNPMTKLDRHGATKVIDGIEQQKSDDIHLLRSLQ